MKQKRFFALLMAMLFVLSFVFSGVNTAAAELDVPVTEGVSAPVEDIKEVTEGASAPVEEIEEVTEGVSSAPMEETKEAAEEELYEGSEDNSVVYELRDYELPDYELRALPAEAISYNNAETPTMQITCEARQGIYFLNGTQLLFYALADGTLTEVCSFDSCVDAYTVNDMLYVLESDNRYVVYNLAGQCMEETYTVQVQNALGAYRANAIGVDSFGRIYIAAEQYLAASDSYRYQMYLFSDMGMLLSKMTMDAKVYHFSGFDAQSGNFFMESAYTLNYADSLYPGRALTAGNSSNNKLKLLNAENSPSIWEYAFYDGNGCIDFLCEEDYYLHQNSAALFNSRYLVITSTAFGSFRVVDPSTLSPYLELRRAGVEAEQYESMHDISSIGVRAVYFAPHDSVVVYINNHIIGEYDPETKTPFAAVESQYNVFNLLMMDNHVMAIEKDNDDFYLEIFAWRDPSYLSIQAETDQMKVGDTQQLSAETDLPYQMNVTWESSNKRIVSVTSGGVITAWREGTAVITASVNNGRTAAELVVTVTRDGAVQYSTKTAIKGKVTKNCSANSYLWWSYPVNSYLMENADGSLTRVEYTGSDTGVLIETYTAGGTMVKSQTIANELSLFGGFFAGKDYNYLVFGAPNPNENDSQEVVRVVKYSKDWKRLADCKICGANTYIPFEGGSLRMTETDGKLYVYTCHEMYDIDGSGIHHQSNMTFVINENSMKVEQSFYDVMNISVGYVSHSFNQFIETDGTYIYRVDHGDAEPRAISLTQCAVDGSITDVAYAEVFPIQGYKGDNATGVTLGGFALSDGGCMFAGSSVDQNSAETYNAYGLQNIFLKTLDFASGRTWYAQVTDYTEADGIIPLTPQLVKLGGNQFLLMWEEYISKTESFRTRMATIDKETRQTSEVVSTDMRLSDCQPILTSDGLVRWYAADGARVTLYTVDPYDLEAARVVLLGDLNDDGVVAADDALTVLKIVVKLETADALQTEAADVDGIGSITAADALLILQKVVKLIDSFPIERL